MKKIFKLLLSFFSVFVHIAHGDYDHSNSSIKGYPDATEETNFVNESLNNFERMKQANRNMINKDKRMMDEAYDPNEATRFKNTGQNHSSLNRNSTFPDQERLLRGNEDGS